MKFIVRGLVIAFALFPFVSCGTKKSSEPSENGLNRAKLVGYWRLKEIEVNGSTKLGGEEIIKGIDTRMFVITDETLTEYNVTKKTLVSDACINEAKYQLKGRRIVLPERKMKDATCREWSYEVAEQTDDVIALSGWVQVDGKTYYDAINRYERVSSDEGKKLMSAEAMPTEAPRPSGIPDDGEPGYLKRADPWELALVVFTTTKAVVMKDPFIAAGDAEETPVDRDAVVVEVTDPMETRILTFSKQSVKVGEWASIPEGEYCNLDVLHTTAAGGIFDSSKRKAIQQIFAAGETFSIEEGKVIDVFGSGYVGLGGKVKVQSAGSDPLDLQCTLKASVDKDSVLEALKRVLPAFITVSSR